MALCPAFRLVLVAIAAASAAVTMSGPKTFDSTLSSLADVGLSCPHALHTSAHAFDDGGDDSTAGAHAASASEEDPLNVFSATINGVWSLLPADIVFMLESAAAALRREAMRAWTARGNVVDDAVPTQRRMDDAALAPVYDLHALAGQGDVRAAVCLAELRLFTSTSKIPVKLWASLLPVDMTAASDARTAAAAAACAELSLWTVQRHPRCTDAGEGTHPHLLLSYATASDAVVALSSVACVASEVILNTAAELAAARSSQQQQEQRVQVGLDVDGSMYASSAAQSRAAQLLSLPTVSVLYHQYLPAAAPAAVRLEAPTPHWQLPLRWQGEPQEEVEVDVVDKWRSFTHVAALPGLLLRTDVASTIAGSITAYAEAMTMLAALHLARVRVRVDSLAAAVNATCAPLPPAFTTAGGAATTLTSLLQHAWGGQPASAQQQSLAAYLNSTASIHPSDDAALETLAALAFAGTSEVASIITAQEWLHGASAFAPRAHLSTHDVCMQAMSMVLPIVQDAVMDSAVASTAHAEETFAQLWEAHEDAYVVAAAKDTQMNVDMLLEEADVHNDAEAQVQMAELLMYGYPQANLQPDPVAAQRYFQRAADAGHADAAAQLGMLLLDGGGGQVPRDVPRAHELLLRGAAEGNVHALAGLGYMYETGTGVPRNLSKAVEYLEQAAAEGAVNAHSNLGALYLLGSPHDVTGASTDGVVFNATAAAEHLRIAHAYGFAPATFNLGLIELNGWTRAQPNCTGAMHFWLNVARRARWMDSSLFSLGSAFDAATSGDNAHDAAAALRQYLLFSLVGSPAAADNAAFMLEHATASFALDSYAQDDAVLATEGSASRTCLTCDTIRMMPLPLPGVPLDRTESDAGAPVDDVLIHTSLRTQAVQWYAAAASQHHAHALKALADCYMTPWADVPRCDPSRNVTLRIVGANGMTVAAATAMQLLDESAAAGFGHAYFTLAYAYASGQLGSATVSRNITKAWEYLDFTVSVDALAEWPVFVARLYILQHWLWQEIFSPASGSGNANGLQALLIELLGCAFSYPETQQESDGYDFPGSTRSSFSTPAAAEITAVQADFMGESASDERLHASDGHVTSRRAAHKHKLGLLPLTDADRQLCTVVARTSIVVALGLLTLALVSCCLVSRASQQAHLVAARASAAAPVGDGPAAAPGIGAQEHLHPDGHR